MERVETMSAFQLQCIVADYYGLDRESLIGTRRMAKTIMARHMAMYLCRTSLNMSYPSIGGAFGGRDHTTIIHAVRRIAKMIREDESIAGDSAEIRKRLNDPAKQVQQEPGHQLSEVDRQLIVREVLLEIGRRFKMEAA